MKEIKVPLDYQLTSKTDILGNITHVNNEFIEISGFSEVELLGRSHNIIRHPDVPSCLFEDLWKTLKAGDPWVQAIKNRCKNGDYYWILANVSPIFKDEECVGFISVRTHMSDIDIANAEQNYLDLEDGRLILHGGEFLKPWQLSYHKLMHFLDRLPFSLIFASIMVSVIMTSLVLTQDFSALNIASHLCVIGVALLFGRYFDIKIKQAESTVKDLRNHKLDYKFKHEHSGPLKHFSSALKELQINIGSDIEELKKQHQRDLILQKGWEISSANLMLADVNYNITFINEAMRQFFIERSDILKAALPHFDVDSLIGQNIDVFHSAPHQNRETLNQMTQSAHITMPVGGLQLSASIHPILDKNDRLIATLVEWDDITDEHRLIQELDDINRSIDEGIFDARLNTQNLSPIIQTLAHSFNLTMDLSEKQQKILLQQSRHAVMGEMISMISHQWKQPLNVLSLGNSMMKKVSEKHIVDPAAQKIALNSVNRSETMINELNATISDFSNFFNPKKQETHFSILEVLTAVQDLLNNLLENHHIHLSIDSDNLEIYGAQRDLQQVIINIVKNAIDQLVEQKITHPQIKIHCHDKQSCIQIQISDNGGGIKDSMMNHLFDAYQSTKSLNGTGLGLYMSKMIINEQFKGHIEAHNNEEGAVFTLHLPKKHIEEISA